MTTPVQARLRLEGIQAGYGRSQVLHGVDLTVAPGEIVTVLGHNGAGKTTALKCAFGLVRPRAGRVLLDGVDVTRMSTAERVRRGVSLTPAEAPIFRELSVRDNLALGAYSIGDRSERAALLEKVYQLFPLLKERQHEISANFSGGQQRLLSLGIALMSGARIMLLDEPSLGIAPGLVTELFAHIRRLCDEEGMSVLLIEQNVRAALPIADRAYYLRAGQIILEESAEASSRREHWWDLF